jgi:hypothetical protein
MLMKRRMSNPNLKQKQDHNVSTSDTQVDKQDQQSIATGEEELNKATTQTPTKSSEVNVELSTNTGTENIHSVVVPTISTIDTTPITSIPRKNSFNFF